MDNLLKLPVISSVNDVKGIRQLYDKTEIHIRWELDEKLRTFWEFESIGIKQEKNSVLETFKETITFTNQRYEVGLPWKEGHDPLLR